ncbi:MAG: glutamine synthetase beta-grasp domain-containing protein [Chloroflexi bacterium]|nr:glutamine synthetase beta-grasp domain-containing protein [Chloroflexota bacterium]MDA1002931.1 glutamine synthetase beta-grasp domain-containing protein [Chloroflexota bacterium]
MTPPYRAEYIWIDGTVPTSKLRSKTKVIPAGEAPPVWGFDGSSTNQAPGSNSDCVLNPVFVCPDPIRGGDDKLVLCEVLLTDMTPHPSNTRAGCARVAKKFAKHEPWFGIEQEYTFFEGARPMGWPDSGFPAPQGGYYCGVGADEIFGREIVEAHTTACIEAGLAISGTNAEVMPAQWEFQIGPIGPVECSDHLWVARWLLYRVAEDFGVSATLYPKPVRGDWNGAGAHTNFSTNAMRESYAPCEEAAKALGPKHDLHIKQYGYAIEERLTGLHETAHWSQFRWGVSDRGASVRIPWQVARDKKGYIEDRRPNANMDPYTVTRLVTDTICSAFDAKSKPASARKAPAR